MGHTMHSILLLTLLSGCVTWAQLEVTTTEASPATTAAADSSSEATTTVSPDLRLRNATPTPDFSVLQQQLIPILLNVSENVVTQKDKDNELLSWEAPLDLQANYPYYLSGFDYEDRPIWIAELGKWNVRKVIETGGDTFKNFDKYVQQTRIRITKSRALRSTPDHPITEAVFIVDLDQLDLAQVTSVPTVSYILNLARQYRKLLTEHTGVAVVVNANFVAETLVNLIRPVFGSILEKTEIYGTNKARWLPNVLRHFPQDQIPEWYGGSKGYTPIKVYG